MTALLGLLAIAGYQNRTSWQTCSMAPVQRLEAERSSLEPALEQEACLAIRFKQNGQGETAQSWINDGPNKEVSPPQLKQAIGSDVLAALEQQTGLSQEELLARLSRELPGAVDKYTPGGRLPSA